MFVRRLMYPALSLAAAALFSGCLSLKGLGGYEEFSHDGRIYVLSRAETIASFKATHEVQYGVTKIGKGPKGETVVVEADAKDPWLQNTLWTIFKERRGMK
jgi:hypothetical protein